MKTLIVITGPTASGKTLLAVKLAHYFKSEIISSDSRQFYRGMNIGTAKPGKKELDTVRHHFIDTLDIIDNYNVGKFEEDALLKINLLFKNHDILFLTGGSGLYCDAVCNGIDVLPESSQEVREELNRVYQYEGIEVLQEKLFKVDPEYYSETDVNNPHRLIRALEVFELTGKKYSSLRKNKNKQRDFIIKKIGLLVDRTDLYSRINKRVDEMIRNGLVKEVESLLPFRNENAMQTVGYKEIIEYFDQLISLDEAIQRIKQHTRNYAKRQMTWFRKDQEIKWFDPTEVDKMIAFIEE